MLGVCFFQVGQSLLLVSHAQMCPKHDYGIHLLMTADFFQLFQLPPGPLQLTSAAISVSLPRPVPRSFTIKTVHDSIWASACVNILFSTYAAEMTLARPKFGSFRRTERNCSMARSYCREKSRIAP